jgi:ATP-dependent Zn protease
VGGFARTMPDEDVLDSGLISKAYLQARLVVALGGRAAELVVFGPSEITQGAAGDLEMVSRIGRESNCQNSTGRNPCFQKRQVATYQGFGFSTSC